MGSSFTVPESVTTNAFSAEFRAATKPRFPLTITVRVPATLVAVIASLMLCQMLLPATAQATPAEIAAPDVPQGTRVPSSEPIQRRSRDRQKGQRKNLPADWHANDPRGQPDGSPLADASRLPPANYSGRMLLGWHFPQMKTQGKERERYQAEPGILLDLLFANNSENQGLQPWYGLGLVTTEGSGIYEKAPGRFGYIYLGPRLGFGQMLAAVKQEQDPEYLKAAGSASPGDQAAQLLPWKFAHFFLIGLNARITTSASDPSLSVKNTDDFKPGLTWEKPGISAQYQIHWLQADGWSVGPGLGAILGAKKTMIWLDFSTSLYL